jgi:Flp pilus assembly protein CpaB
MPRLRRPLSPVHLLRQLAAAALLAVAVVLAVRPAPAPVEDAADPTVPMVVAAVDLPAGTALAAADLAVARLPPGLRPAGTVPDPAALSGRVLAAPVRAGEAVTDVRLVGAGLTALLPDGHVAAPVRLADLAVAALVHSGDRIDVLATPEGGSTAEVVAEGALVLAAADVGALPADDPSAGLLLVAVDAATAARLAAAATTSTLTVTLPPP